MSLLSGIIAGALVGRAVSVLAGTARQSLPEHVTVGIIGALAGAVFAHALVTPHLTSNGSLYGVGAAGDGALVLMTFWRLIRHF